MGLGITPPGAGRIPSQGNQGGSQADMAGAEKALQKATEVFDTESMGVTGKMAKGGVEQDTSANAKVLEKDAKKLQQVVEHQIGSFVQDSDDIKKKRRKKSKFEESFEEMQQLEEVLDPQQAETTEEKGVIGEFLDNMDRIRRLRSRLKRQKQEEKSLKRLMEQEKEKEEEKRKDSDSPRDKP